MRRGAGRPPPPAVTRPAHPVAAAAKPAQRHALVHGAPPSIAEMAAAASRGGPLTASRSRRGAAGSRAPGDLSRRVARTDRSRAGPSGSESPASRASRRRGVARCSRASRGFEAEPAVGVEQRRSSRARVCPDRGPTIRKTTTWPRSSRDTAARRAHRHESRTDRVRAQHHSGVVSGETRGAPESRPLPRGRVSGSAHVIVVARWRSERLRIALARRSRHRGCPANADARPDRRSRTRSKRAQNTTARNVEACGGMTRRVSKVSVVSCRRPNLFVSYGARQTP